MCPLADLERGRGHDYSGGTKALRSAEDGIASLHDPDKSAAGLSFKVIRRNLEIN